MTSIQYLYVSKCFSIEEGRCLNDLVQKFTYDLGYNFREIKDVYEYVKDWCWGEVQFDNDDDLLNACAYHGVDLNAVRVESDIAVKEALKKLLADNFEQQIMSNQNSINLRVISLLLGDYRFEKEDLEAIDGYLDEYLEDWLDHINVFDRATSPEDNYKKVRDFVCEIAYDLNIKLHFLEKDAAKVIEELKEKTEQQYRILFSTAPKSLIATGVRGCLDSLSVDDFELVENPVNGKSKLVLVKNHLAYEILGLDLQKYKMPEEHKAEQKKSADRGR